MGSTSPSMWRTETSGAVAVCSSAEVWGIRTVRRANAKSNTITLFFMVGKNRRAAPWATRVGVGIETARAQRAVLLRIRVVMGWLRVWEILDIPGGFWL